MKDLSIYFQATSAYQNVKVNSLGASMISNLGDYSVLQKGGVAIVYVPEFRGDIALNSTQNNNGLQFRSHLKDLFAGVNWSLPIYDLGDILPGKTLNDTYFALSQVVAELVKFQIIPIIIGGSQDLTIALYKGYEALEQMVNLCCVDYQLDLGHPEAVVNANGYLSHLLLQRPCYLFNHANIGLQVPFASKDEFELFDKLYFDTCRLGEFNADFKRAEPHLRNSDILSIDLKSVRASEMQSDAYVFPNGFYAEQICQIAKYAGASDKLTSFGIFNYYEKENQVLPSNLLAQLIWYFIDGVSQRWGDFPIGSKKDYLKFSVHMEDMSDLIFFKSNRSDRWWMEVPYPPQEDKKYERHHLIPCNADDYQKAMQNEIPDLWWKTYRKLG